MNRFLTIGIASTLALGSIAGAASAAGVHEHAPGNLTSSHDNAMADQPQAPATGWGSSVHFAAYSKNSTARIDRLVRNWKGGRFDVVPIGNLDDTALKASIEDHARSEPGQVGALQAAIGHNRALSERLKAQNVDIGNIVDAQSALDGGLTFYLR